MKYQHDMSNEKEPQQLLPEGTLVFTVEKIVEAKSKKGNDMFIVTLKERDSKKPSDVFMVSTPGKRWFLKNFLSACDVAAAQNGIYAWDLDSVIGKKILGKVEHINEKWINREGQEVTTPKSKITEFLSYKNNVAWDDEEPK